MSTGDSILIFPPSIIRDAAIVPSTRQAYSRNLNKFLSHTRLSLPQLLCLPPNRIDWCLSVYFDYEFHHRGSYHNACHALFGLIFECPSLKPCLGESRLRLRGWRRLIKHRSHPPITWELTVLFATVMSKWGYHAEAVGTLLSFDCYLRVGELTRLQYADVVQSRDPRVGSSHRGIMALRLAVTKTGQNQWVDLGRSEVAEVLMDHLKAYPFMPSSLIFPFSPAAYRLLIREVASSVGLGNIPYVPHSFRHGGATCDYMRGASIDDIMFRGRWESLKSAKRYVQTARALLIIRDIPAELDALGGSFAAHVVSIFRCLGSSVTVRLSRSAMSSLSRWHGRAAS
jgi:hypothetical protein